MLKKVTVVGAGNVGPFEFTSSSSIGRVREG